MHTELKPGQVITGRRVRSRRPIRVVEILLTAAFAFALGRTGTTITNISDGPKPQPAVVCGGMACGQHAGGRPTGGGGTIRLGPTA